MRHGFALATVFVGVALFGACADDANTSASSSASGTSSGMAGPGGGGNGPGGNGQATTGGSGPGGNPSGGNGGDPQGGMGGGGRNQGGLNQGGQNQGGQNQGGQGGQGGSMMGCNFSSLDGMCNLCLDGSCMMEKTACCATTGCVPLVNCAVSSNCTNPVDINCVQINCSVELANAGGIGGPGSLAALDIATCGETNCPQCLGGGQGGAGGVGQGGMGTGGMGQGGMGTGGMGTGGMGTGGMGTGGIGQGGAGGMSGGVCDFSALNAMCNQCVDVGCPAEEAACCNEPSCVPLVNCALTNCPQNPVDLTCLNTFCPLELAAAQQTIGIPLNLAQCGQAACPTCL